MATMDSTWRRQAAPIIAKVLRETAGQPEKAIKAALQAAYPFGPRSMHPYKMWCKEIRCQRFPHARTRAEKKAFARDEAARGPAMLFEE